MASDLLSTIQSEIEARVAKLRPLIAEYEQLVAAAGALGQHQAGPSQDPPGRSAASPPAPPRRRARRGSAAGALKRASSAPERSSAPASEKSSSRAPRGAAREAILAALDHGSHTVAELAVVTAMSTPNINGNLRRLLAEGSIAKTEREGKVAYVLASSDSD